MPHRLGVPDTIWLAVPPTHLAQVLPTKCFLAPSLVGRLLILQDTTQATPLPGSLLF